MICVRRLTALYFKFSIIHKQDLVCAVANCDVKNEIYFSLVHMIFLYDDTVVPISPL